jgi:hypothetical protein
MKMLKEENLPPGMPEGFALLYLFSPGQKKDPAFGKRDRCAVGFGYFF